MSTRVQAAVRLLALAVAALSLGQYAMGQDPAPQPRFMSIRVIHVPSGEVLPGVQVNVRRVGDASVVVASGVTGARGETRIGPFAPARYEVTPELNMLRAEYTAVVTINESPAQVVLAMSFAPQPSCGPGMVTPASIQGPVSLERLPVGRRLSFLR
jgi:hypothetical protein